MEFGLLGPLEIRTADGPLPLGRPKQQALLALLLLHANQVVARDRLIDELWGEAPPETAVKAVQVYVSQLRKVLPMGMLVTRAPGYMLTVDPERVDLLRFQRLTGEARDADPARASSLLREALGFWRGSPLQGFGEEPFARIEAGRLQDLRLAALEERIEADLALGRHHALTAELEVLIAEQPHRERLRAQLMLALYRSGRQAEALAAYRAAQAALHELGLEPSTALRGVQRQILNQDPALELPREEQRTGAVALPGPLIPASPFPFVGRAREVALLRSLLERVEGGEGAVVLVAGEAGAGKTRLIRELAHEAAAGGALVLYGTSDAAVSTPYQPLREWIEFALRAADPEALREGLAGAGGALARLVPELARLAQPPPAESADDRHMLVTAARTLLAGLSRTQPLLLVADDLHWADAETLFLVRQLARTAPESRLLVVALFREDAADDRPQLADTLAELARLDGVGRLALGNLSDDDVAAFVRASADADASPELSSAIGELTSGTPLLVCELWRELRDSGAVEVTGGAVRLVDSITALRGADRFRDLVRQRLLRLTPETVSLLELAAVAGPQFELRVLVEPGGDQATLVAPMEASAAAGFVEELPEPPGACRFTHELVRRAVYDRIGGVRRAALHLRVGEALEHIHAADQTPVLPELAHHFTLAAPVGGIERAVQYNLRAGSAAMNAASLTEAAARLATALDLGIDDPRECARVQVELAHLLYETGQTREADAMLAASLHAATGLGERSVAARALVDRLGHRTGDPSLDGEELRKVAQAAVDTLSELGDPLHLAAARVYLGIALQRLGRRADSVCELERALLDADTSGDAEMRRRVVSALGLSMSGGPMPVPDAIGRFEQLLAVSGGDLVFEAVVERMLGRFLAMAGRFDDALELIRTSGMALDRFEHHAGHWVYRWAAADAMELAGDLDGAERELLASWRKYREFGHHAVDQRAMHAAYMLAFHYCDRGRWDAAAECIAFGAGVDVPCPNTPPALRCAVQARLAARAGRHDEALTLVRGAQDCVAQTDDLNLRARVWATAAEVRRAAGDAPGADAAVAEALRLYEAKGNIAAAGALRAAAT